MLRRVSYRFAWLGVVSATVFSACDDVSVNTLPVSSIEIAPRSVEIAVGEVVQLTATAYSGDGSAVSGPALNWSSSDPAVASVDASGRVTGLAPGTVAVTATGSGVAGSAAVSIGLPAQVALSDADVQFSAVEGGADPADERIGVDNRGGVTLNDLVVDVIYQSGASAWLDATLASSTAPTVLTLSPRVAGLTVGTYGARVTVRSDRSGSSQDIAVTLTVAPPSPDIRVDPDSLTLGGRPTATGSVQVRNAGAGVLDGLAASVRYPSGSPSGWLTPNLSSPTAPTSLGLVADGRTLVPGSYRAEVLVSSSRPGVATRILDVVYVVDSLPPSIEVTPAAVTLVAVQGQGSAPSTSVSVRNGGDGVLTGLGTAVSYGPGQPTGWLTSTLSATAAPATLTLTAATAALAPGRYDASVEIRGSAANSPRFVAVTLTVQPPTGTPPAAPSALVASATSGTEVQLGWTDNANNETSQEVERSDDGGASWSTVATLPLDQTTYGDSGLTAGATYLYRVRACNGLGCSAFSNTATVTTPAPANVPNAPTGLTATPVSSTEVDLRWTDASTNESRFEVERRVAGGPWTQVANLTPNTQSYRDSGLLPGEPHEWQVRACNPSGCSGWVGVAVTMPPSPPSNLVVTGATSSQVDLQWVDNSTNETQFAVQRLTGSGWQTMATLPPNTTTWSDVTVSSRTVYFYRVAACAPVWCIVSNTVSVLTP
ncbi:MAG: fibronectin type III domain-containing protein [Gemmatimonadota bacterium]